MSGKALKPLLVFGLRGTLLERIHVRNIPPEMPIPDLTVGMFKVWLRPNILSTILELQKHCKIAIWSSTTARNTFPVIEAIFNNKAFLEEQHIIKPECKAEVINQEVDDNAATEIAVEEKKEHEKHEQEQQETETKEKSKTSRLTKRSTRASLSATTMSTSAENVTSSKTKESLQESGLHNGDADQSSHFDSNGRFISPFKFEFVWTREHTSPDYFRRAIINIKEDEHATLKDLNRIFSQFPEIATPSNTVLIDDTPSKARRNADNMLWLDTCELLAIRDNVALTRLLDFVNKDIAAANDVREILPARVRLGGNAAKLQVSSSAWSVNRK